MTGSTNSSTSAGIQLAGSLQQAADLHVDRLSYGF